MLVSSSVLAKNLNRLFDAIFTPSDYGSAFTLNPLVESINDRDPDKSLLTPFLQLVRFILAVLEGVDADSFFFLSFF